MNEPMQFSIPSLPAADPAPPLRLPSRELNVPSAQFDRQVDKLDGPQGGGGGDRVFNKVLAIAGATATSPELIAALQELYQYPVNAPRAGDVVNLAIGTSEENFLKFRAVITRTNPDVDGTTSVQFTYTPSGGSAQIWYAMLSRVDIPEVYEAEFELETDRKVPTPEALAEAIETAYEDADPPCEGDIVNLLNAGVPAYRATMTPKHPGTLGTIWALAVTLAGATWYAHVVETSSEFHFENDAVRIDVDGEGVRVHSKEHDATLHIDPADIEKDMQVRPLEVIDGDSIKRALALASEPEPLDDPRHVVLGLEAGANIEIEETETAGVWKITAASGSADIVAGVGLEIVTLEDGRKLIRDTPDFTPEGDLQFEYHAGW